MGKIKKFNELFDTEELKSQHEIDYLQGAIDTKNLVSKVMDDKHVEFIYGMLSYKFPFFAECTNNENPYTGVYGNDDKNRFVFWFKNETWFTGIIIDPKGNKRYDIGFIRKGVNVEATLNNTFEFTRPVVDYDPSKVIIISFPNLYANEIINHVEKYFIPIMIETGFDKVLSLGGDSKYKLSSN